MDDGSNSKTHVPKPGNILISSELVMIQRDDKKTIMEYRIPTGLEAHGKICILTKKYKLSLLALENM